MKRLTPSKTLMKTTRASIGRVFQLPFSSSFEVFVMQQLADRKCVPCTGSVPALTGEPLEKLKKELPQWTVVDEHHLVRQFRFPDFKQALAFVNRVGEIAEAEGHHPDILLGWGKAEITLWTHTVNGLTESDFILAAKIGRIA